MILAFLLLLGNTDTAAQRYNNIINYRWEHGFAATVGYSLGQDENRYIWIGTENGLMRFNGRDFKVYTTRDGLPDNEITALFPDKKGHLWLIPFANDLAYLKNSKIMTRQNDPALARLSIGAHTNYVFPDSIGNTWIVALDSLWHFKEDHAVKIEKVIVDKKTVDFSGPQKMAWIAKSGKFTISMGKAIYQWNGKRFVNVGKSPFVPYWSQYADTEIIYDHINGKLAYCYEKKEGGLSFNVFQVPKLKILSIGRRSGNKLFLGSGHSVYVMDITQRKWIDTFFFGAKIGALLLAKDTSLWVGTSGGGIFRLTETSIKTLKPNWNISSVIFIKGTPEGMYATTNQSFLVEASVNGKEVVKVRRISQNCYVEYIYVFKDKLQKWIFCGDVISKGKMTGKSLQLNTLGVFKHVLQETEDIILAGTSNGIFRICLSDIKVIDTLFGKRVTTLAKIDKTLYAGTANGLVAILPDKKYYTVAKDNPLLEQRIMALSAGKNGMLWCANNKGVLVGLLHDSVVTVVGLKEGLQCNRISCLKASEEFLWVGTDNGLFAITNDPPYRIVKHITYTTGLNSNQVNCLDIYRKRVWVGTSSGINYFDENGVFKERDKAVIIVNNIVNGTRSFRPSGNELRLEAQTLTVDFDIVDFSGGARPVFQYKFDNGNWVTLENNHLYFPSLPYGKFKLKIRAYSPNWTDGAFYSQDFYNPAPFYTSWWFVLVLVLIIIAVAGIALFLLVKRTRNRYRQKLMVQQNLLHLEQMALQGQMNPHFIFNCISAIKQYYSSGSIEKANSFVDSFSLLIRHTFEMGTETFVSLDKELNYLARYLDVEKTRFNDSFRYSIYRHTILPETELLVPAMLLQPIVENAVRHGVRHLPDGVGEIGIGVVQQHEEITITIEDNGIGRAKSNELKTHPFLRPVTSTSVNKQRITLLNRLLDGKLVMRTTDIYKDREASGTRVIISYPVNIKEILKDENSYR